MDASAPYIKFACGAVLAAIVMTIAAGGPTSNQHKLTIGPSTFLLDGESFQIISDEMHYACAPHEYGRARRYVILRPGPYVCARSGTWAVCRPGYCPALTLCCAATIRSSWSRAVLEHRTAVHSVRPGIVVENR